MMTPETARQLLPLTRRLDWRGDRLAYLPRAAYGDPSTWRARLERRLKHWLRAAWCPRRLY